jgi:two-component system NarL family sensor kinase
MRGIRKFLIILLYCTIVMGATSLYAQTSDSLIAAYNGTSAPEERGKLAMQVALQYDRANPALFLAWSRKGYADVKDMNVAVRSSLARLIAETFNDNGGYDSAAYYLHVSLDNARAIKSDRHVMASLSNLGLLYSTKGEYRKALEYQLPALSYFEQNKDLQNIRTLTMMVGNTYHHMRDERKALSYFNRIYPALKGEQSVFAAKLFNNMALSYAALGDHAREIELLGSALAIRLSAGDSLGMSLTMNNLGKAALALGNNEKALAWFRQALSISEDIGNKQAADEQRQNIAGITAKKGNPAAAIAQYKQSLVIAKSSGSLRSQKYALENLIGIYDSLHDYASAYHYIAEYQGVEDTTRSVNYVQAIADAETRYETQRALRARDSLQYESRLQALARARAVQQRNNTLAISACTILALLAIFGFAWRDRTTRARTREEQRAASAIFEGEQAERIRIARDLHDSIGQMLAVTRMRLDRPPLDNLAAQLDFNKGTARIVDQAVAEVRAISHNLIPEDLTFGTVRALENLCSKMADTGGISVELHISDQVRAHQFNQQFSLSLYRIVQEVLGNMMKHSGASAISLSMLQAGNNILLEISDNGKGFDTSIINAGRGIGWKNVFARVRLLNGSVDLRSERISGTSIQISLPQ